MNLKTCSNCRHWVAGQCRVGPPIATNGGAGVWAKTAATDWCHHWQRPEIAGKSAYRKITDEQVLAIVRVYDEPMEGVPRVAMKRSDLVEQMMTETGITATPALKRIERMERDGLLETGNNPWPLPYPTPGIYVWMTEAARGGAQAAAVTTVEKKSAPSFLDLVRGIAPDASWAMSVRKIVEQLAHTMPMSATTAHRKLIRLVRDGAVLRNSDGYYAAPFATPNETTKLP